MDDLPGDMASEPQVGPSASLPHSLSETERRAARYLFAISDLSESGTDRITTSELGNYLGVAPASVTEMVSKLDDRDLVAYEKYRGVTLTEQGRSLATRAGWRFCVVSTFFDSVLDLAVDDETAFDFGVVLSRDGMLRLHEIVNSACLELCPGSNPDANGCAT